MNLSGLTPVFKWFYPGLIWDKTSSSKTIYLTFDDGPVPVYTESVLEILARFQIKATFFCVGDNIRKHPDVFQKVIQAGHKVGNHTFHHCKGWQTPDDAYFQDILKCQNRIEENIGTFSTSMYATSGKKLFRPPHGRIRRSQIGVLKKEYEIVMWSVLSEDYKKELKPEDCLKKTLALSKEGSIVVFHDSIKSAHNTLSVLPQYIETLQINGYKFEVL